MFKVIKLTVFLALFSLIGLTASGQQKSVSGTVTDESAEPLPGVTVMVKGTTNGTITDTDGKYMLSNVSGSDILQFSFIGMKAQEITVGNQVTVNVTLVQENIGLEEVVAIGYGTKSKRKVTTAVSSVNAEELTRSSSTTTAGALSGKMAGLSTRAKDARPGRGIDLEIRNMGNPLYVVDGIPYGGDASRDWLGVSRISGNDVFNSLSLEDIESISILKDAAAAIYGLRAANGVVLITTKKGKEADKVTVNINGYYGWQNLTRFPELANAGQYIHGQVEAAQNAGIDPSTIYTKEELAKWEAGNQLGYKSYDYYDLVMRKNVPQYNLNANVNGGTKRSKYYMSLSRVGQEALMKDFDYERTNFQVNLSSNILKGLTLGTQTSLKLEDTRDVGLQGGDGYFSSLLAVFANRPTVGPYAHDNPEYINNTPNRPDLNPALFSRDIAGYKDTYTKAVNVNLFAEYKFDFGLSAKYTYSQNYTNVLFDGFQYTYDLFTHDEASDTYNRTGGQSARWRFQTKIESMSHYHQFQLNYAKTFAENHNLSAVFGYERSDWNRDLTWLAAAPTNDYIPLNSLAILTGYGDEWTYQARAGYLGRIDYSYKDKYLLQVLGRYDASYLYAPGHRWGFFPGVSAGWRISDEGFFEKLKGTVNDLKFRVSVGQTGQEAGVGVFGYLPGYSFGRFDNNTVVPGSVLDGEYVTGMQPQGLPVTNLSWEKHTMYDAGIDAAFLKNKLTLTADVFRKVISGIPAGRYDVLIPNEVGYSLPNENLNKNEYRGAEGMITYKSQVGDLRYNLSANITYSRFRYVETYKPRFGNSYNEWRYSSEDRWGGIWWGYEAIGQFQSVDEIRNYPIDNDGQNNRTQLPGDIIYKDVNNDGVINWLDEGPIGYPDGWAPMLSFGGNIGLQWKNFDLNLDFAGAGMQSWFQNYELRNPFHAGGNTPAYLLTDRWHRADPYDPDSEWIPGRYPAIRNNTSMNNGRNSDFWLHDVRFLRLKNAEFGYNLPKSLLGKSGISNARVYVSGSNLFSIDNVRKFGIDPEIQANAAVVYPQQRTIMVGFNLTF
ncbi:TonB-dependent receptor [Maribellus sp. CM-23]|uniref:SusC/RagA family TonB-linked outer membrane protein n=1 Tax=Maribellus sp. CM-23 TaxID=2781026 RepID=UPI001F3CDF58|nr:TonB-dependent receptor [Maribellus sp. CM-23]MCE4566628.1 TonB-dependent receptor [Maribellus sp. CM-23]